MSVEVVIHDLISGRCPIPLKPIEINKGDALKTISVLVDDIVVILDDGSKLIYSSGEDINTVASHADLANDSIEINSIDDIKSVEPNTIVKANLASIQGTGLYDGMQDWWFINRRIKGKSYAISRFSIQVSIEKYSKDITFKAGTDWSTIVTRLDMMSNFTEEEQIAYDLSVTEDHEPQVRRAHTVRKCVCSSAQSIIKKDFSDLLDEARVLLGGD